MQGQIPQRACYIVTRIAILTESRADWGIYLPLLEAMQADSRFELMLLVTGSQTMQQIRVDGFDGYVLYWPVIGALYALPRPDWFIVLGDRRPMLEAAIEAAYRNIPVAHIQGGDRTGTIDDPCRHAITRFANLHFPCTQQSADRLIRMGEEPWRIKVVGPLGIYAMGDATLLSKAKICQKLGLSAEREIVLVIQHPVSTQVAQAGEQMKQTLAAVKGWQTVVIYPNSDSGSEAMIEVIKGCEWVRSFRSLPYLEFVSLLRAASVIVGNSSTGLYEAPLFGVPAVNIGIRQNLRERALNIIDCGPEVGQIQIALRWQLGHRTRRHDNPFDVNVDGVNVILEILAETVIDERLLQKRLTY